jgi:hypothetical protein
MDSSDWSNGIRCRAFDTRPDTEFKLESVLSQDPAAGEAEAEAEAEAAAWDAAAAAVAAQNASTIRKRSAAAAAGVAAGGADDRSSTDDTNDDDDDDSSADDGFRSWLPTVAGVAAEAEAVAWDAVAAADNRYTVSKRSAVAADDRSATDEGNADDSADDDGSGADDDCATEYEYSNVEGADNNDAAGPGEYCPLHHRVPLNSREAVLKCVG